jgi:hypothetical protein
VAGFTDIASVLKHEHDILALETQLAQCPPLVAVNDREDVARVPTRLRWRHGATVEALATAKGGAFVVDCPSLQSKVLWVATKNDFYREDYLTFLNRTYGLELSSLPSDHDVDHLYNRSRALTYGLQFLRLALVEQAINRSHGAAYEKDLTQNEASRERRGMKLMDEVTSMKYFGFLSPLRDDPRESEISAYATFAGSKLGLDPAEVRRSILYLRQKASTPWAPRE